MIEKTLLIPYISKEVVIGYWDSQKEVYSRGTLLGISDNSIQLQTRFNLHIISLENIFRFRVPLE